MAKSANFKGSESPKKPNSDYSMPATSKPKPSASGSPGTGALWLSIFGIFFVTAILGVILGLVALRKAKREKLAYAKAVIAIVIGLAWLVFFIYVSLTP